MQIWQFDSTRVTITVDLWRWAVPLSVDLGASATRIKFDYGDRPAAGKSVLTIGLLCVQISLWSYSRHAARNVGVIVS